MKRGFRPARIPLSHPHEAIVAPIVGDGAIASAGIGDGRMFPLVILDTRERPDIERAIAAHVDAPPGDVTVQWGQREKRPDTVLLTLRFVRPAELIVFIEFEFAKQHGILVEGVLESRGLYLQAGLPGDRVGDDLSRPKVLAEVPDTGFRPIWDELYRDFTIRKMRAAGLSRPAARRAAEESIAMAQAISRFRPSFAQD